MVRASEEAMRSGAGVSGSQTVQILIRHHGKSRFLRVRRGHSGSKQGSRWSDLYFNRIILAVVLKQTVERKERSGRPVRKLLQ